MKYFKLISSIAITSLLVGGASFVYATNSEVSDPIKGVKEQINDIGQRVNISSGLVGEKFKFNDSGLPVNTAGGVRPILSDIVGHWAEANIKDLIGKGIVDGDNDNQFNPDNPVNREELATMVAKMFNLKNESTNQDFNDVPLNRWSYHFVEETKDFFTSNPNTNGGIDFSPLQHVKREDAAAVILKALIKQNSKIQLLDATSADDLLSTRFSDLKDISISLRPYVATAIKNKVIEGEDMNLFLPQKIITRAEAATLLDRLVNNGLVADTGSVDHSVILEQMKELAQKGQVSGTDFIVGKTLINDIHQKLGQPDAKNTTGEYSESYSLGMGHGSFTFVVGKGEVIDEIRSYGSLADPSRDVSQLTRSIIEKILGNPDKIDQINNQQVLIYNAGDYQLKFNFTASGQVNGESSLDHFGVYSPKADTPMGNK
ncbi:MULTISPECIES: DUF4309 domain-containing protein [unclassified Paenibacillus]|uniref:DUF4309 domain-containing protein n=1 Tax=unclassified Paenibacillus TaxID=185978 RepID=UPI0007099032|nr:MULTISPECIES: DUF4309 domain-containing protein [unclassified Paenibacillus]KQX64686.1 hypothetical protein ASD40_02565 [Paenibacillus sp. Root444D2]KRE51939.1 hypothetical protein ASG85_02045 [Paenibacillus sp. Soil724D2]